MKQSEKIAMVKKYQPDISDKQARKDVRIVDWLTKWDDILQVMHRDYTRATQDKLTLMEFSMFFYETDRNFPREYAKRLTELN